MNIQAFLSKKYNGKDLNYSNRTFIEKVYFPTWHEYGLDLIYPEIEFISAKNERYYIDFVIKTKFRTYLIEIDDFGSHAGNRDAFNKHTSKKSDVSASIAEKQFKCDFIKDNEIYSVLISLTLDQIKENPDSCINQLNFFFKADTYLNIYFARNYTKEIIPTKPQEIVLSKIRESRILGEKKGLVSLTTALGKTFISILHAKEFGGRVLFLAHIVDILTQTENSFTSAWPEIANKIGYFIGDKKDQDKQVILATVQTLTKNKALNNFDKNYFDTIIIDETHHATSPSYQKIIEYFEPKFFLGLTGTHERHDGEDVLKIYDNNLIHEITREEARDKGWIVNCQVMFFKDNVDYSKIYWNGHKYREEDLNKLLIIEKRDKSILQEYENVAKGKKTIGFCCSIEHAIHMANYFKENNYKAEAIHSKTEFLTKEDRKRITDAFKKNKSDMVFTVDTFNEGVDFPDVECLLMLRETQSNVIRSQQLGRGLRLSPGKEKVILLDFISNDRKAYTKMDFLGDGFKEPRDEKDKFYFDNNGDEVIFDKHVYEEFKRLEFIYSSKKSIDEDSIPENWKLFGEDLKNDSQNNLYWKNGNMPKDIPLLLSSVKILDENPHITDSLFKIKFSEISGGPKNNAGFRGLIFAKMIGLIDKKRVPTKVFHKIAEKTNLKFDNFNLYEDEIQDQLEKLYYWTNLSGKADVQRAEEDRQPFDKIFKIYYFMALYKVLSDIGFKTGNYFITFDEFEFFVVTMRSYNEYEDVVNQIISLRNNQKQYEIIKYLRIMKDKKSDISDGMDTRIAETFKYSKFLEVDDNKINLKGKFLNIISERLQRFERLLNDNKAHCFDSDNPESYFNALYNLGTPWQT